MDRALVVKVWFSLYSRKMTSMLKQLGIDYTVPAMDVNLAEARQVFETNFFAVILMCQAFLPLLVKAQGTIVQIGSVAGVRTSIKLLFHVKLQSLQGFHSDIERDGVRSFPTCSARSTMHPRRHYTPSVTLCVSNLLHLGMLSLFVAYRSSSPDGGCHDTELKLPLLSRAASSLASHGRSGCWPQILFIDLLKPSITVASPTARREQCRMMRMRAASWHRSSTALRRGDGCGLGLGGRRSGSGRAIAVGSLGS
jgi:hypothetical protein